MIQFQITALLGKAFVSAAPMTTAINAYIATGICTMNQNTFADVGFAPMETTDDPEPDLEPFDRVTRCHPDKNHKTRTRVPKQTL